MKDYIWLKPEIVAAIKFAELTTGSILRHPEFIDLRDDKRPAKSPPIPKAPPHTTSDKALQP